MAKNNKGKQFYEVTREKPLGKGYVLLMGSSIGSAVSFFIVSLLGSFYGIEIDDLVFFFILSSFLGFVVGGLLTWLFVLYFSKVTSASSVSAMEKSQVQSGEEVLSESSMASEESEKGRSVDFVFPELSPDK
jgi:high-affinity Fe2+/Pb2+ permease